jgi:hypothetical protein
MQPRKTAQKTAVQVARKKRRQPPLQEAISPEIFSSNRTASTQGNLDGRMGTV